MARRYRRASEVGEWFFCHQAWWLHHVAGHAPANRAALEQGRVAHAAHSRTLHRAAWLRRAALFCLLLAALLALLAWATGGLG